MASPNSRDMTTPVQAAENATVATREFDEVEFNRIVEEAYEWAFQESDEDQAPEAASIMIKGNDELPLPHSHTQFEAGLVDASLGDLESTTGLSDRLTNQAEHFGLSTESLNTRFDGRNDTPPVTSHPKPPSELKGTNSEDDTSSSDGETPIIRFANITDIVKAEVNESDGTVLIATTMSTSNPWVWHWIPERDMQQHLPAMLYGYWESVGGRGELPGANPEIFKILERDGDEYKIQWVGYPASQWSWDEEEDVFELAPILLKDFNEQEVARKRRFRCVVF
ncbi:hypothetical protein G7046_g6768 [Stylonectria norvegica]|nr:hypothetical protein G7046_g6768 [Stylonectria norvegica]